MGTCIFAIAIILAAVLVVIKCLGMFLIPFRLRALRARLLSIYATDSVFVHTWIKQRGRAALYRTFNTALTYVAQRNRNCDEKTRYVPTM